MYLSTFIQFNQKWSFIAVLYPDIQIFSGASMIDFIPINILFQELLSIHRNNSWILEALDESLASSVRVLDTGPVWNLKLDIPKIDQLKAAAVSVQNDGAMNCWNPYETAVIAVLVQALLKVIFYLFMFVLVACRI